MAEYRKLMLEGKDGFYLCNPSNLWEAIKLAWYMWRQPDKVAALIGLKEYWIKQNCEKDDEPQQEN